MQTVHSEHWENNEIDNVTKCQFDTFFLENEENSQDGTKYIFCTF